MNRPQGLLLEIVVIMVLLCLVGCGGSAPAVSPTPIPIPPVEEVQSRYEKEVRSLTEKLQAAEKAPADFKLPPSTDWQISLVPLSDRLYYVQTLLFPEWSFNNSGASTRLYVVYTYERGEGLTGFAPFLVITQEVIAQITLVAETGGKFYLLEEDKRVGGSGSEGNEELVQRAIERLKLLGNKGEEIETILETIIGYATGLNWNKSSETRRQVMLLQQALTSQYWADKKQAANALGEIGPEAQEAVPALVQALPDENISVRRAVIEALGEIGPGAAEAVPALIQALDNEDIRYQASEALEKIGPAAQAAVPSLTKLLTHESPQTRLSAAKALGKLGSMKEAIPVLLQILSSEGEDEYTSQLTIEALKELSGQDFGTDASLWQQWWEAQK